MAMNAAMRLPKASLPLGALQRHPSMLYGSVTAQGSRTALYSGMSDSRARARAGRHHVSRQVQMSAGAQAAFYDFNVQDIDGEELSLSKYKGKAVLVVNVASQCGFTAQYAGLSELYNRYQSKGLEILAFPCNQFGGQEPGSNEQIKDFAQRKGAEFQMLSKVDVNGPNEAPLYAWLKSKKNGGVFELFQSNISWNFNKFLLDRNGEIVGRYGPMTTPEQLESDIQKCLA